MKSLKVGIFIFFGFYCLNLNANEKPAISQTCVACHGADGKSVNPLWPNLAGQKEDYLKKQLVDFREGRRKDPVMEPLTKSLTDEDIQALSKYFSKL